MSLYHTVDRKTGFIVDFIFKEQDFVITVSFNNNPVKMDVFVVCLCVPTKSKAPRSTFAIFRNNTVQAYLIRCIAKYAVFIALKSAVLSHYRASYHQYRVFFQRF